MLNRLIILTFFLIANKSFGQKEYEFPIRSLFFYYDHTDTLLKKVTSEQSDFKLYYYNKNDKSIIVYSTTKPFPNDFSADSCNIYKSRVINVKDFRLSDSISTFTYTIKYCYKDKKNSLKDFKTLCKLFNLKPETNKIIEKAIYFELDNADPVCIRHYIQIIYEEIGKNIYSSFSLTFQCSGERDIR